MPTHRIHTLYLQSKHRNTGTTSQYTIALPNIIESDPNLERFKVCLKNFSTYNDFYLVKEGCCTIAVNGSVIELPHGTYTYQRLARMLKPLVGANVVWDIDTNTMTFEFVTVTSVMFDDLGTLLGFDPNELYTGTIITSVRPMRPYEQTHILVHLNNAAQLTEHLTFSNHSGNVRISNILGKVLINASPFQLITHQQVLESDGLYTADNSMGCLEILITDNDGNEFTDMGEHELVLTVESLDIEDYDQKTMVEELKEIKKTCKDLFLYKALRLRQ